MATQAETPVVHDPARVQNPDHAAATETAPAAAAAPESSLVLDDLLVEDVSIDGMCGVY
jgi:mycofactocin precursor